MAKATPPKPVAPPQRLDGRREVMTTFLGMGIGLLIGLFLTRIVANTPLILPARRFFWLLLISAGNGALVGLVIESMRQLQMSSPDPAYHQRKRRNVFTGTQTRTQSRDDRSV